MAIHRILLLAMITFALCHLGCSSSLQSTATPVSKPPSPPTPPPKKAESPPKKNGHVADDAAPPKKGDHVAKAEVPAKKNDHVAGDAAPPRKGDHVAKAEVPSKKNDHVAKDETPVGEDKYVSVQVHYGTNRRIANEPPSILMQLWDSCWLGLVVGGVWGAWTVGRKIRKRPVGYDKYFGMGVVLLFLYGGYNLWIESVKPNPGVVYGSERDSSLSYGIAEVTIPNKHAEGAIESPKLYKLEFNWDPAKHNILRKTQPQERAEFFKQLKLAVAQHPRKAVLLFVHGYNTSFADASRRVAQITLDMKMPGVPMLFSWPSFGEGIDYPADWNMAMNSKDALVAFLTEIHEQRGADQIWILAHSMGNLVVTQALTMLEAKASGMMAQGYVALAPDVDRQAFSDEVPRYKKIAKYLALYCSSKDEALRASRDLTAPKAGDSNPTPLVVSGLDTFDASIVDTGLLGHSYYGTVKVVVDDIGELVRGIAPAKRTWLELKQGFWKFLPPH
jgi:esterase/lipase superfamily enzyme